MKRTRLRFQSIQQIVGADGFAVVLLTDEARQRALSVVCDEAMSRQILLRLQSPRLCRTLLPEALLQMMTSQHEMMIYGIHEGQYQVVLADRNYERSTRIRMSDAVLLTMICEDIPLYIEDALMERQSVAFDPKATGIAIPINTMDNDRLKEALSHAIEVENYELASHLRDEINRRKNEAKQ
jgi:hypothetical protein